MSLEQKDCTPELTLAAKSLFDIPAGLSTVLLPGSASPSNEVSYLRAQPQFQYLLQGQACAEGARAGNEPKEGTVQAQLRQLWEQVSSRLPWHGHRRNDGPQNAVPNRWVRGKCQGTEWPECRILEQGLGPNQKPTFKNKRKLRTEGNSGGYSRGAESWTGP